MEGEVQVKPSLRPFHDEARVLVESLAGRPLVMSRWVLKVDVETVRKALEAAYRQGLQNRKQ